MSRSGYSDDLDQWDLIRWRGAVAKAMRGKRGQKLLREMLAALDAMPDKRLIAGELQDADGEVCALGALGVARGIDLTTLDPDDHETVAKTFNVAESLIREIEFENDEQCRYDSTGPDKKWGPITPERRWQLMREWVAQQIRGAP